MTMTRFYIIHIDEHGERHEIGGTYEAIHAAEAIAMMLREAGAEDDGYYFAHESCDDEG
jgi:hypothetical protein